MIHASFHLGSPGSSLTYILSLLIVWYRMARWAATGPSAQPRLAGWKGCSILQLDTLDKHSPFWEPTIHHHVFTSGLFTVTKVPPWFNCLTVSILRWVGEGCGWWGWWVDHMISRETYFSMAQFCCPCENSSLYSNRARVYREWGIKRGTKIKKLPTYHTVIQYNNDITRLLRNKHNISNTPSFLRVYPTMDRICGGPLGGNRWVGLLDGVDPSKKNHQVSDSL